MIDQLKELYNAEIQMKILIEKMAYQTSDEKLRHSLEQLSKDTEAQNRKLDKVFSLLGVGEERQRPVPIIEGIGRELQSFIETNPETQVRDAGFLAIAQKAIHYEISLYRTLSDYAHQLNHGEAESLLNEILEEEKQNDRAFTATARSGIDQRAADPPAIPETS